MAIKTLAAAIAGALIAVRNCEKSNNTEWLPRHRERIQTLMRKYMPSGSGIDAGVTIDMERSTPDCLVFDTGYHHMNDGGYYDGWTEHTVRVRPSLYFGFNISISGRDRNEIKEYLHEVFDVALRQEIEEYSEEV